MPDVVSAGVRIHYEVAGQGPPLVLVHGYTSSSHRQYGLTGWVDFLAPGRTLLMPDLRGHGLSEKPHDPAAYSLQLMAADVLATMDDAGLARASIMGYSMGGMVALELLLACGDRFDRAIVGGMGAYFSSRLDSCRDEELRAVPRLGLHWLTEARVLCEYVRNYDHAAMSALARSMFRGGQPVDAERLPEIRHPVLCVAGTRDWLCPGTRLLAERLPDCRRLLLPRRNHYTAVRDPAFRAAVADFLWGTGSAPDRRARAAEPTQT